MLVLACGSSPRVTDPGQRFRGAHDIEIDGDYLQAASGAVFPRRLDGFERGLVRANLPNFRYPVGVSIRLLATEQ